MTRGTIIRVRAVLLAGLLIAAACDGSAPGRVSLSDAEAQRPTTAPSTSLATSRRNAIVDAAARVSPSVVSIHVESRRRVASQAPWDFFFVPRFSEQLVQSYGTGFVLRADGILVTNQHVVAGAETITVSLPDGAEVEATLLGEDPTTDLAVLKVPKTGLPVPPLGRSADLMIGEWVVALGNPYAYLLGNSEPTVTAGVVSATGRNILPNTDQPGLYLDMIQTDAAINPGNSGGPLTNALGEVIGLNSSILSDGGGSIGLGFAIPIERVLRVSEDIIRSGSVRRAWTGLEVAGATAMRDWKSQGGVTVARVAESGPAARAGIREGAVLIEANGRRLRNYLDWESVKLDLRVGDAVDVRIRNSTATRLVRIQTADLPSLTAAKVTVLRGIDLISVTPGIQGERGVRADQGALIYRITPEVRQATGLQEGDVIVAINRSPVTSAKQVADFLESSRSRQVFRLTLERAGQYVYTDLSFQ